MKRRLCVVAVLALGGLHAQGAAPVTAEVVAELRTRDLDGPVAELRWVDVGGRDQLATATTTGRVERLAFVPGHGFEPVVGSTIQLPDPQHCLLSWGRVLAGPGPDLIVMSANGVSAFAPTADARPIAIAPRARFPIRTGRPLFAAVSRDVNGDGFSDLILPATDHCQLWLHPGAGELVPTYRPSIRVPARAQLTQATDTASLTDTLQNLVSIPPLDLRDLNGDGLADVQDAVGQVLRIFLQGADGGFGAAPIELHLDRFRDNTPKAAVQPGRTLVATDEPHYQVGDLDGDRIPDYVVAHRRKLWVFVSDRSGPQFDRPRTRAVAEDVSGFLLTDLDGDQRLDLLIAKLQVPDAASLALGLISSLRIDVTVVGYAADPHGDFSTTATWRRELSVVLPPLLSLIGDADKFLERLRSELGKYRRAVHGQFDGHGDIDLVMASADGRRLDLWRDSPEVATARVPGTWLRSVLFEAPEPEFDIDRLLTLTGQLFEGRTAALTATRPPAGSGVIDVPDGFALVDLAAADVDGDGVAETVVTFANQGDGTDKVLRVMRWR